MLAKIWKKLLLAICIIACIYNVMSKLVNRTSLEDNLKKANDGNTVFEIFQKDGNTVNSTSNRNATNTTNSTSNDIVINETVEEDNEEVEEKENEENKTEEKKGFNYQDYVILN